MTVAQGLLELAEIAEAAEFIEEAFAKPSGVIKRKKLEELEPLPDSLVEWYESE